MKLTNQTIGDYKIIKHRGYWTIDQQVKTWLWWWCLKTTWQPKLELRKSRKGGVMLQVPVRYYSLEAANIAARVDANKRVLKAVQKGFKK